MKKIFLTALSMLASMCASAQMDPVELPDIGGIDETPTFTQEELIPVSKKPASQRITIPKDCDSAGFNVTLNFPGVLEIAVEVDADDKNGKRTVRHRFQMKPVNQKFARTKTAGEAFGRTTIEIAPPEPEFKNQIISIPQFDISYYIRPHFVRYGDDFVNKSLAKWESLSDALNKNIRVDVRPAVDGMRVFVDGRFAALLKGSNKMTALTINGGTGPTIDFAKAYKNKYSTPEWEVIDFGRVANPGAMKDSKVSMKKGFQDINGIPMIVSEGDESSDLSLCKSTRGIYLLEIDYNLSRDAFERLPEAQITSVPNGFYSDAYVLFALDPDPKRDRAMTLRLTRFCDEGRGVGFSHTDITFPRDDSKFPANISKAGSVKVKKSDGTTYDTPLYLGKFPIKGGDIIDIIDNDPHPRGRNKKSPYLDFELFGRRGGVGAYVTGELKPANANSAVNVFGVTLRRSPCELHLEPSQTGNIFYNDEKPETGVNVKALVAGKYFIEWIITDTYGKEIRRGRKELNLAAEQTEPVKIDLAMPDLGHYQLKINIISDIDKRTYLTHNAMFALLGKDTRLATPAESPFGTWWFGGAHHTPSDINVAGEIMLKAGIRRTTLKADLDAKGVMKKKQREDLAKYKLTLNQFGWCGDVPTESRDAAYEYLHEKYDNEVAAFPDTKYVTVFHESFGDSIVPEVWGEKTSGGGSKELNFTQTATYVAEFFREFHPNVKLCYGNNTSSQALTAALLRNNFDMKLFDFVGIETPGQGCIPERLWQGGTQGTWFAQEVGRTYGHDLKVTGCFEFSARPARILGLHKQAEYYMRDALTGLAYGYETLGISGVCDPGNGYNQTLWGDGGLCTRNPELYPKPMYAAYATMTRVLDQIEFNPKILNTGANTTYALEFKRKRGDKAYAFWLPMGQGEIRFTFPKETTVEYVEFYGKTVKKTGKTFTLPVSTSPAYIVSPVAASKVEHLRTISAAPEKGFTVADKFDDLSKWRIYNRFRGVIGGDIFRKAGKFELKNVNDEEKGKCLEVKLVKEGNIHDIYGEITKIELKKPVTMPGKPDEIGMWVKGDGGWGKIGFEIQDAEGRLFRSEGGWQDFGGETFINFSGWRFMSFPIDGKGVKWRLNQSLGGRWNGNAGGPITYPVKVNALYITLRRKALNPSKMVDVPGVIRLKDIGTIINPENQITEE